MVSIWNVTILIFFEYTLLETLTILKLRLKSQIIGFICEIMIQVEML